MRAVVLAECFAGKLVPRDPVTLVEPHSQVDESARERAEWTVWVSVPDDLSRTMRTMRVSDDGGCRPFHGAILSGGLKAVNLTAIADSAVAIRCGATQREGPLRDGTAG